MKIGEKIKLRRKELGISADKLAEKLGKDRSTIFRYEKGDIENLPIDLLKPIADALYTTPQYLMGWSDEKPIAPDMPKLTEDEKKWMELYHKLPDTTRKALISSLNSFDTLTFDQQKLALDLLRVALKNMK